MGWYFGSPSRAAQIEELTRPYQHTRTLRKFTSGNTLWTVRESTNADGTKTLWIGCDLIQRARRGEWGYKPLDESMGPCEVSCPLAYLDMVPCPAGPYATEWRARVRAYHQARNKVLAERRARRKAYRAVLAAANAAPHVHHWNGRMVGDRLRFRCACGALRNE